MGANGYIVADANWIMGESLAFNHVWDEQCGLAHYRVVADLDESRVVNNALAISVGAETRSEREVKETHEWCGSETAAHDRIKEKKVEQDVHVVDKLLPGTLADFTLPQRRCEQQQAIDPDAVQIQKSDPGKHQSDSSEIPKRHSPEEQSGAGSGKTNDQTIQDQENKDLGQFDSTHGSDLREQGKCAKKQRSALSSSTSSVAVPAKLPPYNAGHVNLQSELALRPDW